MALPFLNSWHFLDYQAVINLGRKQKSREGERANGWQMVFTEAFWPCGTEFLPGYSFLSMLGRWQVLRHMTSKVLNIRTIEGSKAETSSHCRFEIIHRDTIFQSPGLNAVSKILSPDQLRGQQNTELSWWPPFQR